MSKTESGDFYKGKSLFFLAPEDHHCFEILESTTFSVLKFTNHYLDDETLKEEWLLWLDYLIAFSAISDEQLLTEEMELNKIAQLMELTVSEWSESQGQPNRLMLYLIRSIFEIVKRNTLQLQQGEIFLPNSAFMRVLSYIHHHIYKPEKLVLQVLSDYSKLSKPQLNRVFKRETSLSAKQYVEKYKLKLIENRLIHSSILLKEISGEFGFSDLSHFNKFFHTHHGMGPKAFRDSAAQKTSSAFKIVN